MHAIIGADIESGLSPGAIYVLRNRNSELEVSNHNRLHPYYLVYISKDGDILVNHTEVKTILDLLRANCKGISEPIFELCKAFNKETKEGRDMSTYSGLLGEAIRSMIDSKQEKDIDSLFSGNQTTALVDEIKGLDDFELIAFLVIKESKSDN